MRALNLKVTIFGSCLLLSLTSVISSPLAQEFQMVFISETLPPTSLNKTTNGTTPTNHTQIFNKLRQDGDGGDAVETGIGAVGEGEVGTNVANILQGALGGGFENIFKGAAAFIPEEDTAQGVSTILASLTKPLNTIFSTGFQAGQKYFGLGPTTPATLNGTVAVNGATVAPGTVVAQAATLAPAVAAVTEAKDPDDDDDAESDAIYRKQ